VRTIALVDADPDLADMIEPADLPRARALARTRAVHLGPGEWDARDSHMAESHHQGFLIADGLLSRNVEVMGRACVELIGPGDVIRPWAWDDTGAHVRAEVGWAVLEPSRLAALDHHLVHAMAPWPQLGVELFSRGTRRAHHLAVALAIAHHQRIDDRLLLTLWHLAERWGRVLPEGIVVPLPLGHQRLADLVGASRPTVTTALGELAGAGRLSRREDGDWVLHGPPPEPLRNHRLAAAVS
jgi:hypothetical protein